MPSDVYGKAPASPVPCLTCERRARIRWVKRSRISHGGQKHALHEARRRRNCAAEETRSDMERDNEAPLREGHRGPIQCLKSCRAAKELVSQQQQSAEQGNKEDRDMIIRSLPVNKANYVIRLSRQGYDDENNNKYIVITDDDGHQEATPEHWEIDTAAEGFIVILSDLTRISILGDLNLSTVQLQLT